MDIVVVESPAKAKTINKYLGPGFEVLASFGHVRDLPAKNGSVDPDADFHMLWEVDPKAQKRLNDIAMNKSKTWDERVANFTKYHEYVLSQYPFAPIYQPVQSFAHGRKITMPEVIRGAGLSSQSMIDIAPAN